MSILSQIYPSNDTLIVNNTFAFNSQSFTPFPLWASVAAIGVVFLILSLAYKLRDQQGRVSSERLAYAIMSTVVNGFAAWLSIQIAIPTSVAESISDITGGSQLVVVQNYTVYTQVEVVILFVLFTFISLGNAVYTFTQPEILKPDTGEMKGSNVDSKVRAEEGTGRAKEVDES